MFDRVCHISFTICPYLGCRRLQMNLLHSNYAIFVAYYVFASYYKIDTLVEARSNGAPCEALDDMTPKLFAHGEPGVDDQAPFEVVILAPITEQPANCYRENREYLIRIKPINAAQSFAGFLLQSRDVNENRVGRFSSYISDEDFWQYQCPNIANSVTHQSSERKNKLDIIWTTSEDIGAVKFKATVVKEQYKWCKIVSKAFKSCRTDFAANFDQRSVSLNRPCYDQLPSCTSWSHLCGIQSFVFTYCRETCNRCQFE